MSFLPKNNLKSDKIIKNKLHLRSMVGEKI